MKKADEFETELLFEAIKIY